MADDHSSLLQQLRIDRSSNKKAERHGGIWLYALIFAIVVGGVWLTSNFFSFAFVPALSLTTIKTITPTVEDVGGGALLQASGYVIPLRQATVSAKITGRLVHVFVEEGEIVHNGQIIAQLDNSNTSAALALAKTKADAALANYANAVPVFERAKHVLAAGASSQQAYDSAKINYDTAKFDVDIALRSVDVAQRDEEDTIVRAPFDGVITDKAANEGEIVSPISAGGGFTRTGICTVVDMSSLEVDVDVNESFINLVHPGQSASIKLDAYPDWTIPAHVIAIVPTADKNKGTVLTRIGFERSDARILPQMSATVSFERPSGGDPTRITHIFVPPEAVVIENNKNYVFVVIEKHLEKRAVKLGRRRPSGYEVLSGVQQNDRLAVSDTSKLSDGQKVRVQ